MIPKTCLTAIEALIMATGTAPARVRDCHAVGGGCINQTFALSLEDNRRYFLKINHAPLPGMFEREADGLRAMAGVGAIRVPAVIGCGGDANGCPPFLLLEHVETGQPGRNFFESFGRAFADFHCRGQGQRYGFDADNYIGSTPQPNGWMEDWIDFWRDRRLGFQLRLARRRGLSDGSMDRAGDRLMERLGEWLGSPDEPPCLLHGDLWGGNYLIDEKGDPVLIDPAAYYGRREADLAMTMLFGGFTPAFYEAYREAWPLAEGSGDRIEIYKLYHLLNHLNLFGSGYHGQCMAILRRFA